MWYLGSTKGLLLFNNCIKDICPFKRAIKYAYIHIIGKKALWASSQKLEGGGDWMNGWCGYPLESKLDCGDYKSSCGANKNEGFG